MARQIIRKHYRRARYVLYRETLIDAKEHVLTFIGSFIGIGLIGLLNTQYMVANDNLFMIGSFGASSVLIYGIINSPLAQPSNLIGGHVICAIIGVTVLKIIPNEVWIAGALAVSLSIVAMQITKTLHPPGGATALIAVTGGAKIKEMGYLYVFSPVFTGVMILFLVALVFNNMRHRHYPAKPLFRKRKHPKPEQPSALK